MKNLITFFGVLISFISFSQQPFMPGSIVVVRVGSPDSSLPAGSSPVFLEEFNPMGKHLQTIPISYEGENKLTLGGRSVTEGMLKRSANGGYLTLGGYNLEPGISSPTSSSTAADRVIARISPLGIIDLSNKLPVDSLYPNASFRAVVSNDGNQYWTAGGTNGLRYFTQGSKQTTLISNTVTNMRSVNIQNGNLFLSHGSGLANTRVMQVGVGLPDTPGITATPLAGLPISSSSVCDIFFADLSSEVAGPDVLYLADDLSGLRKYSLVEGVWVLNSITGTSSDQFRGLAGIQIPNGAILYATIRAGNQSFGGGQLAKIVDFQGYNQPMMANIDVLARAATNTGFRGLALSPYNTAPSANTYVFTGNGDWSNPANWQNNQMPPDILPSGNVILILPAADGICVLNINQQIASGGIFLVGQQKNLLIQGNLGIE